MSLLTVESLSLAMRTPDGVLPLLKDVSFTLAPRGSLGVVGESGSGKTLTALAIPGLLPAAAQVSGRILFEGQDLRALPERALQDLRGSRIGMVFQDPMTSLHPQLSVGTQMAEVLRRHRGADRRTALAESARLLDAVKVPDAARRLRQYPHQLSGGQRQRVMLAMALLCRPRLLIADEPTTALDATVQAQVLALLADLRRDFDLALLLISHDIGVIAGLCEQVLVMYAGRVMEHGATPHLLRSPRHPYTRGLLGSRPAAATPGERLPVIPGQPPKAGERFAGCPFEPRCASREDLCARQPPPPARSEGRSACHLDDPVSLPKPGANC